MSLKVLRNLFIIGTVVFFAILIALSVQSLNEVKNSRTAELTDAVVRGKQVWQNRDCNDCHTILGIGGYWAPDLTKEATVRDAAFLTTFLKNPQTAKPGTTMPDQRLSTADVNDVVAFLVWVSKIDTNNWPPQPRVSGFGAVNSSQGASLVQQKNCIGCHRINGQGAAGPGPDLSHVGSKTVAGFASASAYIDQVLQNPRSVKADAIMPVIPMTDIERKAIVDYLGGLK